MSYLKLFTSATLFFSGYQKDLEEAKYVILGVPFDATSTYRSGARFAPTAIREASLNIETYSFRSNVDIEDLSLHDAGDLHVSGSLEETLRRLNLVCREIVGMNKIPVIIGGEHTITLGASRSIGGDFALISFDAHLDLRDKYLDEKICHATFMRRINEEVKPRKIIEVGIRAACKEEITYLFSADNIKYITSHKIMRASLEDISREIKDAVCGCNKVYITIDMDVLDPAYAPAVQNPEPEGLSTSMLLDILLNVCDQRLAIFDLVEVAPHYDSGVTSVQAAKIIFEVLSHLYKIGVR
ncbi:MAG: agmatinase [Candidatus Bathyarchaeia archaeon]|nr:agmatinase [Candidatus Bathyarchaeota archaeon]